MAKREVIVITGKELTKEERRTYKKRNPGKKLCFMLRFPNFPLYFSLFVLVIEIVVLLVWLSILIRQ